MNAFSRQFSQTNTSSLPVKSQRPPTAVVMLNMGGPATVPDVGPFLNKLFSDGMIIQLGKMQKIGEFIAKLRTPKIEKQYAAIGGSPIRKWSELQGSEFCKLLDEMRPETAPHKAYVMFAYAEPLTETAIAQMKQDGVTRAIAFSQYPMYSCTTTGASLSKLWDEVRKQQLENSIKWSVIDRWNDHPTFIAAVARRIELGMLQFHEQDRQKVIILFSAHSLPHKVVNKGDQYPGEVSHTVQLVMKYLQQGNKREINKWLNNPYILTWQSKVGLLPWLGPSTGDAIKGLKSKGYNHVLAVPIAFTSDHVETLFEIDIEYQAEAKAVGVLMYWMFSKIHICC
jgi:ferrochelatase